MTTTTTDVNAGVKSQAEEIVKSGTDIRPRLTEVVSQAAWQSQQSGKGLVALVRAVMDGAREGLNRAVPEDRDDALRQVVDALGDGLSRTALAGKLAVEEAVSSSKRYTGEDLARLRDDLTAVRGLFAETVGQGLKTCKTLTTSQVTNAVTHANRVAERFGPTFLGVLEAVGQHPVTFAREGFQAGMSMGQCATGSLFQALGQMLQRAGEELRQEGRQVKGRVG
jgi:hypothetical protein